MKTLLPIIFVLFFATNVSAQCSQYYPFTAGKSTTLTLYGKKGKVEGTMTHSVTDVSGNTADVTSTFKDKNGENPIATTYKITCNGSGVKIGYESLVSSEILQRYGNMEFTITGTELQLPNNLTPGQSLPDAGVNVKINVSGINMNMNTVVKDRKVEKTETITTPAGTFDCVVIAQTTDLKAVMGTREVTEKVWFAKNIGVVKTEEYNKKGQVTASAVLTAVSN